MEVGGVGENIALGSFFFFKFYILAVQHMGSYFPDQGD